MSIRGARSSRNHAASEATQDLQLMESQFHGVAGYTHAYTLYTRMRALTLRIRVRVTESYTENCTCDKMADFNRGKQITI